MITRKIARHANLILAITLIASLLASSLMTSTIASGAQTPGNLTEVYFWEAHSLSIRYPGKWMVVDSGDTLSIRPIGRDVSDGRGPELVLFEVPNANPDQLESAIQSIAARSGATPTRFETGQFEGRTMVTAPLTWANPDARGAMRLFVLDDRTVIGAAYVVRENEALLYTLTLTTILDSITFDANGAVALGESSTSVASVRLAQPYAWSDVGLVLYFPEGWETEVETFENDKTIIAVPPATTRRDASHIIQATTIKHTDIITNSSDLRALAESILEGVPLASPLTETTVAGYPAVVYEFRDASDGSILYLRTLMIGVVDRNMIALVIFATREADWADFRPFVSAVSSSIAVLDRGRAAADRALATDSSRAIPVANSAATPPALPMPQTEANVHTWEEYGITFDLPEGWVAYVPPTDPYRPPDFELALLSAETLETGSGTHVKLRVLPMLGSSPETLEQALEPIVEDLGVEAEVPYTIAGLEGAGIEYLHEESGSMLHFILIPYGEHGDVLYIQTIAQPNEDAMVIGMLDNMTVEPVSPDYAAVDAAWQASLAAFGTLTVGDPEAPVKMIEFLSFTCGHCVQYSHSMERLIALDVETGRVQLSSAALTGDPYATNAAHATYCAAEQGKGFSVAEALFEGYVDLGYEVAYSRDGINEIAGAFELDMTEFNACIDEERYAEALDQNRIAFLDRGLSSTPTLTFGVDGAAPAPILLPGGETWSGTIMLPWVRDIVTKYIEEGVAPQAFFE